MHFLQAINSDLSVLIVCNKTGGTIKGDIKKILLSRLTPYAEEVIEDHQCGFRNRSTTDHIFCIRQTLEKNGNTMKQCISSL